MVYNIRESVKGHFPFEPIVGLSKHPTCSLQKDNKMNTNVISQFTIDCFQGSLSIIGVSNYRRSSVVFRLTGDTVCELMRDQPPFCKNAIFTKTVDSREDVLIFEYSLREELRNPRKLLKSVRNKLVEASFRNRREDDKEFNEMYTMSDREEHRMWAEMSKSSV